MQKFINNISKANKKRKLGLGGFTLIEVMIALMLLSIGILGVFKLQMAGMRSLTMSRQRLYCSKVASSYLEQMMALDYYHEWLTDGRHDPVDLAEGNGTVVWEIKENQPYAGSKLIRVSIEYSIQNTSPLNFSLEYIKPRKS